MSHNLPAVIEQSESYCYHSKLPVTYNDLLSFVVEISCQDPFFKPHAKMLWDGTSHIGSVVYYQCEEGYYTRSLRNYSVCGDNGLWEDIDLWCEGAMFDDRYIAETNFYFIFLFFKAIV